MIQRIRFPQSFLSLLLLLFAWAMGIVLVKSAFSFRNSSRSLVRSTHNGHWQTGLQDTFSYPPIVNYTNPASGDSMGMCGPFSCNFHLLTLLLVKVLFLPTLFFLSGNITEHQLASGSSYISQTSYSSSN